MKKINWTNVLLCGCLVSLLALTIGVIVKKTDNIVNILPTPTPPVPPNPEHTPMEFLGNFNMVDGTLYILYSGECDEFACDRYSNAVSISNTVYGDGTSLLMIKYISTSYIPSHVFLYDYWWDQSHSQIETDTIDIAIELSYVAPNIICIFKSWTEVQ